MGPCVFRGKWMGANIEIYSIIFYKHFFAMHQESKFINCRRTDFYNLAGDGAAYIC